MTAQRSALRHLGAGRQTRPGLGENRLRHASIGDGEPAGDTEPGEIGTHERGIVLSTGWNQAGLRASQTPARPNGLLGTSGRAWRYPGKARCP